MIKNIIVRSIEKTNRTGGKFLIHKAKMNDGNWIALKFRRAIKNVPEEPGVYVVTVESSYLNRSTTDFGDVYWCGGEPEAVTPYEREDTAAEDF